MCQFLFYHHFIITKSLSSVYIMNTITTLEECQQYFIPLLETISRVARGARFYFFSRCR